jgi:hypothetical protein
MPDALPSDQSSAFEHFKQRVRGEVEIPVTGEAVAEQALNDRARFGGTLRNDEIPNDE